jgi:hypothetical protein
VAYPATATDQGARRGCRRSPIGACWGHRRSPVEPGEATAAPLELAEPSAALTESSAKDRIEKENDSCRGSCPCALLLYTRASTTGMPSCWLTNHW